MQFDVIVIGGSFAGLEAATYLARALRSVCVIDAGLPRNRFAEHSHGYLSRDGSPPSEILDAARRQLAVYPTVELRAGTAVGATKTEDGFTVSSLDGTTVFGKRLILASGITDVLPDLPGLAERWGKTVNHCPYCHGFEFAGMSLGVLRTVEHSVHQARIISEWGPTTYFLDGTELAPEAAQELQAAGIALVSERVLRLEGNGVELSGVRLEDGRIIPIEALYIAPPTRFTSGIAEQLGCELDAGPVGPILRTDDLKTTTVPGVFAAGDITRAMHAITLAAADGVIAGTAAHRSLIMENPIPAKG